jgi:hypothetical protein
MVDAGLLLQDRPDLMEVVNLDPALAQRLAQGPSKLTPLQRRFAQVRACPWPEDQRRQASP